MKKKKYIVANFKANPLTSAEAKKITKGIIVSAKKYSTVSTIVCPSVIHLESVISTQRIPTVSIGAQDTSVYPLGSHTGEVSLDMLGALGVSYVIVGHSERRAMGETEQDVSIKLHNALSHKITPIVCIGELERDKEARYLAFIHDQLIHSLGDIQKKDLSKIIIAYEPVWAIGSDEAISSGDIYEMVIFIQRIINDAFGADAVKKTTILYGGSVDALNAGDILQNGHVDGLLVGRQSLYPKNFGDIIRVASES